MHPYIHSVVNLWKTEKNSSKYLDYMAKSCKFALKKVAKSCKTVSKNIAKNCNVSYSLGYISLDFFDYDRIISLDFFNSYQIICLDYFFFVSLQRENS